MNWKAFECPPENLRRKPSNSKWRHIEVCRSDGEEIRLNLSQSAGELEPVAGARTRDEHLGICGMKVDYEIVIRSVGEEAHSVLAHRRHGKVWKNRLQCHSHRAHFTFVRYASHVSWCSRRLAAVHDGNLDPARESREAVTDAAQDVLVRINGKVRPVVRHGAFIGLEPEGDLSLDGEGQLQVAEQL